MIIKVMPIAVFCSIMSMMLTMGIESLISVLGIVGTFILGLICLSVLLTQIGVPVEALGLVMGIDSFIGMFRCMSNCLGDVAVSTVVAKSEGLLNMDIYRT